MRRRIFSILLTIMLTTTMFGTCVSAQETDAPTPVETSASLTEDWFGDSAITGIASESLGEEWSTFLRAYADKREGNFLGKENDFLTFCRQTPEIVNTDNIAMDEEKRQECIKEMEERLNICITNAETTALVKNVVEDETKVTIDLYEWTFFDYIDLAGDGTTTDVSGFGVDHTVVLEKGESGYVVISDTYSEGELTGMASSDYQEEGEAVSQLITNTEATFQAYPLSYDPKKAAAYADKYVRPGIKGEVDGSYYNPAYKNFNSVGGDCTNFVSQCLYAGGLSMTDSWYYKSGTNYTSTWTFSREHFPYMSKLGKAIWDPSAEDIYMGSPVYYRSAYGSNISHTTICVGKNSAGTPIVNSHNKDYYHIRWNYWGDSANYYTVQMTAKNGVANGIPAAPVATATPRPTISGKLLGDLSDSGFIDATDALEILKGVVSIHQFTEIDKVTSDVDGDLEVTAADALYVLQKVVGLIDKFPAE